MAAPEEWDCVRVIDWLKDIKCQEAIPDFTIQDIDGPKLLSLSESDLFRMTRIPVSKRKELAKRIEGLKMEDTYLVASHHDNDCGNNMGPMAEGLKVWVKTQQDNKMFSDRMGYESDGSWGSDFDDQGEDYVEPLQEMMQPQRDKRQKRPLPPPPMEGMPGSGILPPTIPGRRGEPQNEGQIAYANNSDSGPTPPPLPPSRNHSGNNLNAQLNAHLNSRSPPPHPPVSRTPSGEQPPPLPPGRRGIPNFPAPEAPRQPLPPTPGPPPRIPTTQSRPLPAKPCPERPLPGRPGPGRPGPGRPSDFIKHEPPPTPEDDVEDVYIDPDAGEEYEELPQEEPPSISQNHPATPTQRNRPLPPAPSSNTPPALPPSNKTPNTDRRFQRPPQPLPPAPTPAAPLRPEPENNLQSLLKGVQLRPTGGPAGKNKPANNNSVDSNKPDKQPGFNTIKAAFQERTPIIPKRGSVESNQSSEESSGSGEFPVTPRGAQANNKNSPSSFPSLPNRGPTPRVPSPTPSPPADALCSFVWYFGDIRRADADSKIQFTKDGMFLVRRSKNGGEKNPYTLVVWCESKVWNVHIRLRTDRKYAVGSARDNEQTFSTIPELVDFHKSTPILLASEQGGRKVGQTKLKTSPSK